MVTLYIRATNKEGKRTWQKIGSYHPYTRAMPSSNEIAGVVALQITPGMVYHARITYDELQRGNLG